MSTMIQADLQHIWHPCSQMKDYESFPPIMIDHAQGCYLYTKDGRKIIDAISSWWCKSLGHNHPLLKEALIQQLHQFEHAIFANTTNETIVKLAQKLATLTQNLDKIFFASDGSCAVEIALKMSLHAKKITGETHKTKFLSLKNGYHGETTGALSVSDLGTYREPYRDMLFPVEFIANIPYVNNKEDPLWHDCSTHWNIIENQLMQFSKNTAAIIIEPIVQAAGQMQIYSQDFLKRLRAWTKANNIYLIADEIMTGFYRTGKRFACEHAEIEPDFMCIGKGLTGGFLPMSAVLTNYEVYDLFYDDYAKNKSFLHSHTFSGNVLAASVALATLEIYQTTHFLNEISPLENLLVKSMQEVAAKTGKLSNIRHLGGIVAADLIIKDNTRRVGFEIYQKATELGALLRPLGNTIYWTPPLNIDRESINRLTEITVSAIQSVNF